MERRLVVTVVPVFRPLGSVGVFGPRGYTSSGAAGLDRLTVLHLYGLGLAS